MLVVSRRAGESVIIGDDITVSVLEVRGDVVRIGIDAPRSIAVHREELLAQLAQSNQEAASPTEDTAFVRVMLLPAEWAGRRTIRHLDPADDERPKLQRATVLLEHPIEL